MDYSSYFRKKLCIFPSRTLVNEEGFYYKPTNNRLKTNKFNHSKISNFQLKNYSKLILENKEIMQSFKKIYDFPVYKLMIKNFINYFLIKIPLFNSRI